MICNSAERLDRLPETSFHRRLAMLIGAGLFFDAFDQYLASGIMVALTASGWSTMALNANFVSAGALGTLVGASVAGWMGDRYGRKFAFQFNLLLFGLMSIGAALAPTMTWLIAFRFLMGIGLGAEIVVGYATMGEFVPPATRGKWGAILFFLATSALLVSNVISYFVIPTLGWRWMFAIAGAGGMVVWLLRQKMPESPRWLESVGRHAEARQIVDDIEAGVVRETGQPLPLPAVPAPIALSGYRFADLFRPPLLRATFLGVTLNVVALGSLYGFVIWLPTFLVKQGLSVSSSLGHVAMISGGSLVGVALAGWLADKWSRKNWIIVSSLAGAALGWAYAHAGSLPATTAVGVILITALYFGGTVGFSTYVPELFPTELRLRGTGVSSVSGRAAAIAAPQAVAALYAYNGVNGVVLTVVCMGLAQAVILALFGLNTNKRSLDHTLIEGA